MCLHRNGTLAIPLAGWVLLKKKSGSKLPHSRRSFLQGQLYQETGKSQEEPCLRMEVTRRMGTDGNFLVSEARSLWGIADKYQKTSRLSPVSQFLTKRWNR